jgi:hypothetical protein
MAFRRADSAHAVDQIAEIATTVIEASNLFLFLTTNMFLSRSIQFHTWAEFRYRMHVKRFFRNP